MDQLPNLGKEQQMLEAMGHSSIDDLFADIPRHIRSTSPLPLRGPQSEEEILADAKRLLGVNITSDSRISFLGAGLYQNHVPALIAQLIGRGEFLTAYTPYQPEVSQGMLQAMWEFQTMISELAGLPISNVSVYDGSSAAAEALTCAVRVHNRRAAQQNVVYVSELVPPNRMSVIENYLCGGGIEIRRLPHGEDGLLDLDAVKAATGSCAVYVEQPNPLGILDEGICELKQIVGDQTALIVGVLPTSLGVIEAPGAYGADIVVGEGQALGARMSGGGPLYGIFACAEPYLRQMPGRIVGRSVDVHGQEAYCLTLSTREQHIRRHRATSNICTNETLIALMGAMHMALLGPEGIAHLSLRNIAACRFAQRRLSQIDGVHLPYSEAHHYNEFVVRLPAAACEALAFLDGRGIIGGFALEGWYPERVNDLLVCATDQTSAEDVEALATGIEAWIAGVGE